MVFENCKSFLIAGAKRAGPGSWRGMRLGGLCRPGLLRTGRASLRRFKQQDQMFMLISEVTGAEEDGLGEGRGNRSGDHCNRCLNQACVGRGVQG